MKSNLAKSLIYARHKLQAAKAAVADAQNSTTLQEAREACADAIEALDREETREIPISQRDLKILNEKGILDQSYGKLVIRVIRE